MRVHKHANTYTYTNIHRHDTHAHSYGAGVMLVPSLTSFGGDNKYLILLDCIHRVFAVKLFK